MKTKRKPYKDYYRKKIVLCNALVSTKKKRILDDDIEKAAEKVGIPYTVASRAWKNFVERSGKVDRRRKHCKYTMDYDIAVKKKPCTKARSVSADEAATIILEFMKPKTSTTALSNKYNVSIHQIYSWIHELEVTGKLFGTRVLNPEKYSKPNILVAIAYKKNPYSRAARVKELTIEQRLNYTRVADVLVDYITPIANRKDN